MPLEHAIAYVNARPPTATAPNGAIPIDLTSSPAPPRVARASNPTPRPQTPQSSVLESHLRFQSLEAGPRQEKDQENVLPRAICG